MVARLIAAALRQRTAVFLLSAALLVAGAWAASDSPLDVFPEFAPPIVEIQAEAPGLASEDVEALVTSPLERALAGIPELARIRSFSAPGLGVVTALFPYGADPYRARQQVTERVALVSALLPPGVEAAVAPLASVLSTILAVGLRAEDGVSPLELRDLAEWTLRPRLLAVPGVANVVVYGGGRRQVQVVSTPERLRAAHATLEDLAAAATSADAGAGSGFLDRPGQRLSAWFDGRLRSAADLARAPLPGRDGAPLPLGAVADVGDGPALAVGDAIVSGEPGVLLLVTKQPDVNVLAVTADVERALEAVAKALPAGIRVDRALFRQASFVSHALTNLRHALFAGAILVVIVLLVFLGHVRPALVSVVSIPLSLLAAAAPPRACGATLNVMVLGGLAIAVGVVVDDAIIDVENVWRRLRAAAPGARAFDVVLAASVEVRSPVVLATLMVALVFLPVFLLGGLEGALFRPLATAYVLATLASLAVAVSVTPALALVLLPSAVARHGSPSRVVEVLRSRYVRALERALARPRPVLAVSLATLCLGIGLVPLLRLEFLPRFHETNFIMHMTGAPGVGLDETMRVGIAAERAILSVPGVRSVAQFIGRADLSEDSAFGAERSELFVRLDPDADHETVTEELRRRTASIQGFRFDVIQCLNERIEETLEGVTAPLLVRLRGADLLHLEQSANALAKRLARVPGAVDVAVQGALAGPGVIVRPRREDLLRLGVGADMLERAVRSTLGGIPVGRIVEGDRRLEVVLQVAAASDPARLAELPIASAAGRSVALGDVADVAVAPLRTQVSHEDGVRTLAIRLDVGGRALETVARDVERAVAEAPLPKGVYAEVGGEYGAARSARERLIGYAALSLLGIFLLLVLDLGSPRLATITLVNVPLAFVGGVAAVLLGAGGRLSLGAIVGFVTVFGITIRNGIVLVAHFLHVERELARPLTPAEIACASADRLAPILMTALVTGTALLPLLALGGRAGGEIEQPMALVIVGGLLSSTWLNLFVVPLWYAFAGRRRAG